MFSLAGILLGILLLIGGGSALVAGASRIATRMGVSPMMVGLTIVAFGTSAPELVVNILGALEGQTDLAFGNVIGSNISNLGLVLGLTALFHTIDLRGDVVRREVPLLLLVTSIIIVMALDGFIEQKTAVIDRSDSLVLLLLFGIFMYITVRDLVRNRQPDALISDIVNNPIVVHAEAGKRYWLLVIAGIALLFIGGEVTISSSVDLAAKLGISTTVVGLFVVAVGTSMPELVTSVIAAIRKESDLALGNVIGSNLFNSMIVLPASGLVANVVVPAGGIFDLAVSWLLAAILIPIFFFGKARLDRKTGVLLLLLYIGYAALRLTTVSS